MNRRSFKLGWFFLVAEFGRRGFVPRASSLSSFKLVHHHHEKRRQFQASSLLKAKPKRGTAVDSYQTVAVNCNGCRTRLFRYKKKNGTKSNLIKCFVERIVVDSDDGARAMQEQISHHACEESYEWKCTNCDATFGRSAMIRGLPAIKLIGGKTRMTKK